LAANKIFEMEKLIGRDIEKKIKGGHRFRCTGISSLIQTATGWKNLPDTAIHGKATGFYWGAPKNQKMTSA